MSPAPASLHKFSKGLMSSLPQGGEMAPREEAAGLLLVLRCWEPFWPHLHLLSWLCQDKSWFKPGCVLRLDPERNMAETYLSIPLTPGAARPVLADRRCGVKKMQPWSYSLQYLWVLYIPMGILRHLPPSGPSGICCLLEAEKKGRSDQSFCTKCSCRGKQRCFHI